MVKLRLLTPLLGTVISLTLEAPVNAKALPRSSNSSPSQTLSCSLSNLITTHQPHIPTDIRRPLQDCYEHFYQEARKARSENNWQLTELLAQEIIRLKEYYLEIKNESSGFSGIGVIFSESRSDGYPIVDSVVPGLGASDQGIEKGSVLIAVNGKSIKNKPLDFIVNQLRGPTQSTIDVTFTSKGISRDLTLERSLLPYGADLSAFWEENYMLYISYVGRQQWDRAITLFPALIESVRDQYGSISSEVAGVYFDHARTLHFSDQLSSSQYYLGKSRRILEKVGSPKTSLEIKLDSLALSNSIHLKRLEEASKYFLKSFNYIDSTKESLDDADLSALVGELNLFHLSYSCRLAERLLPHDCIHYSERAYRAIEKNARTDSLTLANARLAFAGYLSNTGHDEQAIQLLRQNITLYRSELKKYSQSLWFALNQIAPLYGKEGLYWEAEKSYLEALQVATRPTHPNHLDSLRSALNLAKHYALVNQSRKAEVYYKQAILQLENTRVDESSDQLRIAVLGSYFDFKQELNSITLLDVEQLSTLVDAISHRYPDDVVALTLVIALKSRVALAANQYEKLEKVYRAYIQKLDELETASGEPKESIDLSGNSRSILLRRTRADAYEQLAHLYLLRNDLVSAGKATELAIGLAKMLPHGFNYSLSSLYQTLSSIAILERRFEIATKYARQSLVIAKELQEPVYQASSYLTLGGIDALQQKYDSAANYFRLYLDASYKGAAQSAWMAPSENKSQLVQDAVSDSSWLYQDYGISTQLNRAAMNARINLNALAKEAEILQSALLLRTDGISVRKLRTVKSQLEGGNLSSDSKRKLESQVKELESKLYSALPNQLSAPIEADVLAKNLPQGSYLLEFQKYTVQSFKKLVPDRLRPSRYLALIMNSSGHIERVDIGDASEIDLQVKLVLGASSQNLSDSSDLLRKLSITLLTPLEPYIRSASSLFLVPDSSLHLVPFGGLTDPQNNELLGSTLPIRVLSSSRDLLRYRKPVLSSSQPVVIANPTYDLHQSGPNEDRLAAYTSTRSSLDSDFTQWGALPSTQFEGQKIAEIFGVPLLKGAQANTRIVKSLNSPVILHIATHGFADLDRTPKSTSIFPDDGRQLIVSDLTRGLQAGIVLAGASTPTPTDDGIISIPEAANLSLSGTQLTVLSACKTGVGSTNPGDGVLGLQRALTISGTRSTLLSLWKVDDEATSEFMIRFYKRLKAGESRSDAFAAIQQEFRNGQVKSPSGVDWSKPYYWAAWQLVGDWRPIRGL